MGASSTSERLTTALQVNKRVCGWNLTTLRFPLVSRSARRNSPARFGSMLSCRRRESLPAPGRHRGLIPEWDTETRTDIRTVLQHAAGLGPLHAGCWDEAGTGAGRAQLPELSAMFRTPGPEERSLLLPEGLHGSARLKETWYVHG